MDAGAPLRRAAPLLSRASSAAAAAASSAAPFCLAQLPCLPFLPSESPLFHPKNCFFFLPPCLLLAPTPSLLALMEEAWPALGLAAGDVAFPPPPSPRHRRSNPRGMGRGRDGAAGDGGQGSGRPTLSERVESRATTACRRRRPQLLTTGRAELLATGRLRPVPSSSRSTPPCRTPPRPHLLALTVVHCLALAAGHY